MSGPRGRVPRGGWLAIGAAAAAAGVANGIPAAAVLVAGLLAFGFANASWRGTPSGRAAASAAGIGAVLLVLRVLIGPTPASPPPLPTDRGPWTAIVDSVGSPRDGAQVARLRLDVDGVEVPVAATVPAYPVIRAGDRVTVDGQLRPPPIDDPYGEYLRRSGAGGTLQARTLTLVQPAPVGLQTLRDSSGDALRRALPEPEAGLAAGILVGLRERVDRTLAADFATAGVSHVVAISGWNIAIVAGLVAAVLRGRSRRLVAAGILATVVAYVVAAGASPSVVRAAVMAGVALLARESGRAGRAPAALGLAAALLLLADPTMIADAGFRLSVMATAGLLAWANPLSARLARLGGGRLPGWLAESLGISLAAQAATLPDVLATFGRLSLVSPVVNLAVVPLVPAAMLGGLVAMIAGAVTMLGAPPVLATVAGLPGWIVLHVIVAIVRVAAALPFAAVALPPGVAEGAAVVSGAAILGIPVLAPRIRARLPERTSAGRPASVGTTGQRRPPLGFGRRERLTLAATAIVVSIAVAALGDAVNRDTRLTVLDVGQGDAILLETRTGARMLIDGGPDPDRVLLALDERIPPWDRRLDILVLTHPHEDHVAGLARILERYVVGRVYEPGMRGPGPGWAAWNAELHDGPPRGLLATGARLRLGEVQLSVLWPDPGSVPLEPPDTGTGINNVSIVFLGEANGRRFLLMGDVERGIDPTLLARGLPRVDVLKIAHHGSATATTQAFVDAVRPRVAVASAGAGNPYGHPAASTLERVRASGARVYRTDQDGSVEIAIRRDGIGVHATGARRAAAPASATFAAAVAAQPASGRTGARLAFVCSIPIPIGSPARLSTTGSPSPAPSFAQGPTWRPWVTAWASPTGYDPDHDHPRPSRSRQPAALARPVGEVRAARVRGGRRRVVPRVPRPRGGTPRRSAAGRDRGAAPRRGQAGLGGGAGPPPPRRRVGGVAGGQRLSGACAGGPGPPRDAARRARVRGLAARGAAGGEDRGLRGQARRAASGPDGGPLRALAAQVPAGLQPGRAARRRIALDRGCLRARRGAGTRAGAGRVCGGPGDARPGRATALVETRAARVQRMTAGAAA